MDFVCIGGFTKGLGLKLNINSMEITATPNYIGFK
jgi:hypothetical protein